MKNRVVQVLGIALVLAGALFACNRATTGPVPKPEAPVPNAEAPAQEAQAFGPGAFDVVKMDRFGGRMGPVYFAHALHADLPGLDGGETLHCSECHRDVCGPPRRCGECHLGRRRGEPRPKLPTT